MLRVQILYFAIGKVGLESPHILNISSGFPDGLQAQFNHMGTTEEYLHHMCYNETLMSACDCTTETMVTYKEREDGQGEGGKKSKKKESHD